MSKYFHDVVLEIGYKLSYDNLYSLKALCSFCSFKSKFPCLIFTFHYHLSSSTYKNLKVPLSLVQVFYSIWASIFTVLPSTPFSVLTDSFVKPFRPTPILLRPFSEHFLRYSSTNIYFCFNDNCFVFPLRLSIDIVRLFTYLCFISQKGGSGFKQSFT